MARGILEYFKFAALLRNPKVMVKVKLYIFEMATFRTIHSYNFQVPSPRNIFQGH